MKTGIFFSLKMIHLCRNMLNIRLCNIYIYTYIYLILCIWLVQWTEYIWTVLKLWVPWCARDFSNSWETNRFSIYNLVNLSLTDQHHPAVCLTAGSKPLPKRSLHILRSTASSFEWQYPLLSLRSSGSFLRLLPYLLVTSISPFIFPSIPCFRRQFLRKMWSIQLAFRFLIACRIFLRSLTWSNTSFLTCAFKIFVFFFLHL